MIEREIYLDKIEDLIDTDLVKVIVGVRRCGKTCLLRSIKQLLIKKGVNNNNIIYISFESFKYSHINDYADLNKFIVDKIKKIQGKIYFLFDEIQEVKHWEKSVNAYRVDFDCDIYITGSNSNLLSGELATLLAGRYIEINVYPFSFNEILKYNKNINNVPIDKSKEDELFNEFLIYGGFPEIQELPKESKVNYLNSTYDSIVLRDILNRYSIRDVDMLNRLFDFAISCVGQVFSANSISKYLKREKRSLTVNKVINYLSYLQDANILFKSKREDLVGKKVLTIAEKYYIVDQGFYTRLVGLNNINYSQILKNIVFIELLRRDYEVTVGKINNNEVDFVCKRFDKTIYIQVSASILDENTRNREFKSLEKINDFYPRYVLSLDTINFSQEGIIHMNVIDFLKDTSI